MSRRFKGREIVKETIALGIGGQIVLGEDAVRPKENDRVRFEAWADYENLKYHFNDDGTCDEMLILTVDKNTFQILEVKKAEPKPEQQELAVDGEVAKLVDGIGQEPEDDEVPEHELLPLDDLAEDEAAPHTHEDTGPHVHAGGGEDHDHAEDGVKVSA